MFLIFIFYRMVKIVGSRLIPAPSQELTDDQIYDILEYLHRNPTLKHADVAHHFSRHYQVDYFILS